MLIPLALIAACGKPQASEVEASPEPEERSDPERERLPTPTRADITIELQPSRVVVPAAATQWAEPPSLPSRPSSQSGMRWLSDVRDDGSFVVRGRHLRITDAFVLSNESLPAVSLDPSTNSEYRVERVRDVITVTRIADGARMVDFEVEPEVSEMEYGHHSEAFWMDPETFAVVVYEVIEGATSLMRASVWDVPSRTKLRSLSIGGWTGFWLIRSPGWSDHARHPVTRTRLVHARDGTTLDVPGELLTLTPDASRVVMLQAEPWSLLFLQRDGSGFRVLLTPKQFKHPSVRLSPSGRYAVWTNDGEIGAIDLEQGVLYGGAAVLDTARAR